jgi:hypothetical protein
VKREITFSDVFTITGVRAANTFVPSNISVLDYTNLDKN